jgi:hypothetical protein
MTISLTSEVALRIALMTVVLVAGLSQSSGPYSVTIRISSAAMAGDTRRFRLEQAWMVLDSIPCQVGGSQVWSARRSGPTRPGSFSMLVVDRAQSPQ